MAASVLQSSFIHLFSKCLHSISYVLGTVLHIWDTIVSKTDKDPCPHEAAWEHVNFCSGI